MSISHFLCIIVVNTQGALHSGAVTQNLDINGVFCDSRTLTGLYLCLNGVTLVRLPTAYLQVMRVTKGRELGGCAVQWRGLRPTDSRANLSRSDRRPGHLAIGPACLTAVYF